MADEPNALTKNVHRGGPTHRLDLSHLGSRGFGHAPRQSDRGLCRELAILEDRARTSFAVLVGWQPASALSVGVADGVQGLWIGRMPPETGGAYPLILLGRSRINVIAAG
jgi:hypothetical protein